MLIVVVSIRKAVEKSLETNCKCTSSGIHFDSHDTVTGDKSECARDIACEKLLSSAPKVP